jgi:hypothetical protein
MLIFISIFQCQYVAVRVRPMGLQVLSPQSSDPENPTKASGKVIRK